MASIESDDGNILNFDIENHVDQFPAVIFLHGIMGNKKNLRSFVTKFLEHFQQYSAVVFDLRNHGQSSKHWSPFTVQACAQDVVHAVKKLDVYPVAIIGHSFGGKVALCAAPLMPTLRQVWLLDCAPGQVIPQSTGDEEISFNTRAIIDVLLSLSWPLATRKALVDELLARGVSNKIALWMTTNLVADSDGLRLVFDPIDIRAMLNDFLHLDGWPIVKTLRESIDVHIVAAQHGQRVFDEDRQNLEKLRPKHSYFHQLSNAGHFVHADNLSGLLDLMEPYFAGISLIST